MIFHSNNRKKRFASAIIAHAEKGCKGTSFFVSHFQIITIFAADFNTHTFIPHTFYQTNPPYRQRMRCLNNIYKKL